MTETHHAARIQRIRQHLRFANAIAQQDSLGSQNFEKLLENIRQAAILARAGLAELEESDNSKSA